MAHSNSDGRTWEEFARLHKTVEPSGLRVQIPEVHDLVQRCLAKRPADRFPDFVAVREELANVYTRLTSEPAPMPIAGYELDASYWSHRALSLITLGRPGEAIAFCDRALDLNSNQFPGALSSTRLSQPFMLH